MFDEMLNKANVVSENIENINNKARKVVGTMESINATKNLISSGQGQRNWEEAARIMNKTEKMIGCFMLLWAIMIIGTIVLCVIGEDIVLRMLHL